MRQSLLVFFSLVHFTGIFIFDTFDPNIFEETNSFEHFLWLLSIDMYAELGGSKMIYLIVLIEIKMICFSNKE